MRPRWGNRPPLTPAIGLMAPVLQNVIRESTNSSTGQPDWPNQGQGCSFVATVVVRSKAERALRQHVLVLRKPDLTNLFNDL